MFVHPCMSLMVIGDSVHNIRAGQARYTSVSQHGTQQGDVVSLTLIGQWLSHINHAP